MYANPKQATELRKKIKQIAMEQSKLPRNSRKWQFLDMLHRELVGACAEARMELDPLALTYK